MASIVDLTNLKAALHADADATADLPDRTWRRIARGEFGAHMLWWLEHPKILAALAKDAAGWSDEDLNRIRQASDKRAAGQARYRETSATEAPDEPEPVKPAPPKGSKKR